MISSSCVHKLIDHFIFGSAPDTTPSCLSQTLNRPSGRIAPQLPHLTTYEVWPPEPQAFQQLQENAPVNVAEPFRAQ